MIVGTQGIKRRRPITRLPTENRDVKGLSGDKFPRYRVGPICSTPGCSRLADHAHHIWRRSFTIGDHPWVMLWTGEVIGNLTGLCWRHHQEVTENKAQIMWSGTSYTWHTPAQIGSFVLDPHPPMWGFDSDDESEPDDEERHEHPVGPGAVEKCPTCNRTLKRDKTDKQEGKRPRKNWSITVPVDEREDGADVLDTLLMECSKIFGHDETKATRYFSLVQALALVVQNSEKMLADD